MPIGRTSLVMIGVLLLSGVFITGSTADEISVHPAITYLAEEFPPFVYLEDGVPTGLGVDLLIEIGRELGLQISPEDIGIVPLHVGLEQTATTRDTMLFSIARSSEREGRYSWIGPFASYDIVLFASRGRNISISNPEELTRYTIGAVESDIAISELQKLEIPSDSIITREKPEELFRLLKEGEIDMFATGDIAGEYFIRRLEDRPELYKIVYHLQSIPLYFIFSRDTSPDLTAQFQKGLDDLMLSEVGEMSRYNQIVRSWLPSTGLGAMTYYSEEYFPYNYQENGDARGIAVDILKEAFSSLNIDINGTPIHFVPWEEGYDAVITTPGTVLFSTVRRAEREDLFRWAGPIASHKNTIFSRNLTSADLEDPEKRRTLRIGAVAKDSAVQDLETAGYTSVIYVQEAPSLIRSLEEGDLDGFAYAESTGWTLINRYAQDPSSFQVIHEFEPREIYFAFHKNTPEQLLRSFQLALDSIRTEKDKDGISQYERILYEYLSPGYAPTQITEEQALSLIHTTAQALSQDYEGTIKDINQGIPPYLDAENPDLYVFVYDIDVNMVAHAANPRMVGANYHQKTDVAGNAFRDHIVEGALQNGTGWVDYVYSNPAYSGLFWKTTAYELVTGSDGNQYVVCAGMYLTMDKREGLSSP